MTDQSKLIEVPCYVVCVAKTTKECLGRDGQLLVATQPTKPLEPVIVINIWQIKYAFTVTDQSKLIKVPCYVVCVVKTDKLCVGRDGQLFVATQRNRQNLLA